MNHSIKHQDVKPALLPIGTRVTHFDGGPSTHGKGSIIRYNGIPQNAYLQEKPKEAIEMAGQAGLLGGLVTSMYDGVRCPYVVRWDYRQEFFDEYPELKQHYPKGYIDVYEPDSIRKIEPVKDKQYYAQQRKRERKARTKMLNREEKTAREMFGVRAGTFMVINLSNRFPALDHDFVRRPYMTILEDMDKVFTSKENQDAAQ